MFRMEVFLNDMIEKINEAELLIDSKKIKVQEK